MLSAVVSINLDHCEPGYHQDVDRDDRRVLEMLGRVPDGARLVVVVGGRKVLTYSAVAWLHTHVDRLHIELSASSPEGARRWYDAITSGSAL